MSKPTLRIAICMTGDFASPYEDWWTKLLPQLGFANLKVDTFFVAQSFDDGVVDELKTRHALRSFEYIPRSELAREMVMHANRNRRVDFWNKEPPEEPVTLDIAHGLRSLLKVADMKRRFEIQHGFEYDVCVHINASAAPPNSVRMPCAKDNQISIFDAGFNKETLGWKMNPNFFYAKSMEFDIMCRAFNFAHVLKPVGFNHVQQVDLGPVLYFFCKAMRLDTYAITKS